MNPAVCLVALDEAARRQDWRGQEGRTPPLSPRDQTGGLVPDVDVDHDTATPSEDEGADNGVARGRR